MTTSELLDKLKGVTKSGAGWKALCPAHADKNPSLSIRDGAGGRILLKCLAGCSTGSVCATLGITTADLFPEREKSQRQIVANYDYQDASGELIYQVCRFDPKDFRQRRRDANALGGWTWNTKGIKKVLFRLPETTRDIQRGLPIFICEGEKDVLVMVERGFSATCNPGGAGKWQDSFSDTLRDAVVVVIADKDKPGRDHAQLVAGNLRGVAKSVRVIELPNVNGKPVKDAADFFAAGGEAGQLQDIVDRVPEWTPNETPSAPASKPTAKLQGSAIILPEIELWPEAVNGAETISLVSESISSYTALPAGAADAIALWIAHAHCFKCFLHTPRLNITSPEKRCGKTTTRDVIAVFVPRPLPIENLTVAVLFRLVNAHAPTILADEYDAWLNDNEELRGILNSGHGRTGLALRCVGDSDEVRSFKVFAPAVLCGIGSLPGTLSDRSICVRLERAKPGELRKRFDSRRVTPEIELCRKLARWCADNAAQLESCDPVMPQNAFNRLADNWRPLFAIAEVAGGDWPQRAVTAFARLTSQEDTDTQGLGVMLLADIRQIFAEDRAEKMFSRNLVATLGGISDRPWPEAQRGKPITENWLARRLRAFGIGSRTLRIDDDRAKGYELADFAEAFERYLSPGAREP